MKLEKVCAGFYIDAETNEGHIDIDELLDGAGYQLTDANREMMAEVAAEMLQDLYPTAHVVLVDHPVAKQ